jgi:hypothetical protein
LVADYPSDQLKQLKNDYFGRAIAASMDVGVRAFNESEPAREKNTPLGSQAKGEMLGSDWQVCW